MNRIHAPGGAGVDSTGGHEEPLPPDLLRRIREAGLTRRSHLATNARTMSNLAIYAGLSAIGFGARRAVVWGIVWLLQAIMLAGCWSAVHEAVHKSLYRSALANRIAGVLWGMPCLLNYSLYQAFHFQHHRFTRSEGDTELDTDPRTLGTYLRSFVYVGFFLKINAESIRALAGGGVRYRCSPELRRRIRVDAIFLLLALALLGAGLALAPWFTFAVWGAPLLISNVLTTAALTTPEHYRCGWNGNQVAVTRTTTSNALLRWVYWNNNFHAEHHAAPFVPYNHLPALHVLMEDQLVWKSSSYIGFHAGVIARLITRPLPSVASRDA